MKCGLLGRKLGHSYSPTIHSYLGVYEYGLFEKEPGELEDFLRLGDFDGLNVTMPYKQTVIPYLDELTPIAQRLGAVNTIVRRNGKLIGHNTDYFGFRALVERSGFCPAVKKCLVLGSGGAAKTVCAVLEDMGAKVVVISRTGENNYGNICDHGDAALLVNATPVGMYPDTMVSPVELDAFHCLECVIDVIYNPARTKLLTLAEKAHIPCYNGLYMLVAQAWEASRWFLDAPPARIYEGDDVKRVYRILRRQMENIILIGMPGCGKTTVGRLLAEKWGKRFVDTDALIVQKAGKAIPEIFAEAEQAGFRKLESEALAEAGKQSGAVIATGGGCVTVDDNYPLLHQNGTVIWLQRDLQMLPTEGRPLSVDLQKLYAQRKPMYEAFADFAVGNNGSLEATINQILEVLP